ncbi:MAG: hypothetical protein R3C44_22485 [Chloroflexota bacterium]
MPPAPTSRRKTAGQWDGAIDVLGAQLDIVVRFIADGDQLSATIDIPQQGAANLPLSDIVINGDWSSLPSRKLGPILTARPATHLTGTSANRSPVAAINSHAHRRSRSPSPQPHHSRTIQSRS